MPVMTCSGRRHAGPWALLLLAVLLLPAGGAAQPRVADKDNCELCHGLPLLARVTEDGRLRNFEVPSKRFSHSTHRTVPCRDCHEDITAYPHPEIVEPVNCAKACHVTRPFELTVFSHRAEAEALALSIHGQREGDSPEQNALKPSCKYCHANRTWEQPTPLVRQKVQHCMSCHDGENLLGVVEHVDFHMTHRQAENSLDIIHVCASCHADYALMEQFGVNPTQVSGFERAFHGKALKRGLDEAAHCADCHSSHLVLPAEDPASTLSTANIRSTCGTIGCHVQPSAEFARAAVHSRTSPDSNPVVYYVELFFILLTAVTMALLFAHILLDFGRWVHGRITGGGPDA
jgi:hypothetical protein